MAGMSQEEKIKRAEEAARKSAEKEEANTAETSVADQDAITEADSEKAQEKPKKEKEFVIKVADNPEYCGIGAGGIQFANGQAVTKSERMASWFREHNGYTVSER